MTGHTPWQHAITPADWAQMTRLHESAHVVASEALGIPVIDVWANVDRDVAHGGQYRNSTGDSQLQAVVYLIGAEGGSRHLREAGYPEGLVHHALGAIGAADRGHAYRAAQEAAVQGYPLDLACALQDARTLLHADGFLATARRVAQVLADRGDRLTGADVRAAIGTWHLRPDTVVRSW
ncbi:hypothetical protein, partial [Kitasatospora griseola]|uniref:hypothetical protein n=1 Tax=Kitasatospora griseola TaxID=2064 RepID=UPI00341557FC